MSLVREAFRQLRKKPCTLKYPVEKSAPTQGFRGLPVWDMEKCILCVLCQNACPPGAIKLVGKGQEAEIEYFLDRCIFCEECVEACPKKAISMSGEFELAGFDRGKMRFRFRKERAPQKPQ
ncbi:MAG: 4Fe-4S binding protein [Candidatus Methanomethylicia archaeon]|nr:4Fe-4S binding protein [Candidatus Methanomethylicia archaeon]